MAHTPALDNSYWSTWLHHTGQINKLPDRNSFHQNGEWERKPDRDVSETDLLRAQYDVPLRAIDINEYTWPDEQDPDSKAWYISQFKRHEARGPRADWYGGSALHDMMAGLVFRPGDTYVPNGDWWLYKYYTQMKGNTRVVTLASSDYLFNCCATSGSAVRIISGTRTRGDLYVIQLEGFTARGLPVSGIIGVRACSFDWNGWMGQVGDPVELGINAIQYSDNSLSENSQLLE